MAPPDPIHLLETLRRTLLEARPDFERDIDDLGQVKASEDRDAGRKFALQDHLRALVLSLLSNQRPWKPIADNLANIESIFYGFSVELVQSADSDYFVKELKRIRCGNRSVRKQMIALDENIEILK